MAIVDVTQKTATNTVKPDAHVLVTQTETVDGVERSALRRVPYKKLVPEVDAELNTAGTPADAKAVGDALAEKVDKVEGKDLVAVDATLTQTGKAADAKKTGDEITDLKNALKFITKGEQLNLTFSAGFVKPGDLSIETVSVGNHLISDVFLVPAMSLLYIPKISKSGSTSLLCECDSTGVPTKVILRGTITSQSDGSYIIVPVVEDTYFRVAGNITMTEYMSYYVKPFNKDIIFNSENFSEWMTYYPLEYTTGLIIDSGSTSGNAYMRSSVILLMKGMTIEFWSVGSSSNVALSEYDPYAYRIISSLIHTNGQIIHQKYTANKTMFVRLSARINAPDDSYSVVLPSEKFYDWKVYYEDLHYHGLDTDELYGKKLTVMGDSLIFGNTLGNDATWITNIGIKYDMNYLNLGINGNTVAVQTAETTSLPMVSRVSDIPTDTDFFVLLGGANDKRLDVPIGDIDSSDTSTFCGALNSIIDSVRSIAPKAKMLFMTTYNRYASYNTKGFSDEDYANAMIDVCRNKMIPCYDNFHDSGVDFTDANMLTWIDESRNKQLNVDGTIKYYTDTHHFSVEGYAWITPIYEALLKTMTCDSHSSEPDLELLKYIESLIEVNGDSAVDVISSSAYVTPTGKYVEVNGQVYFKIVFFNKSNVNSGTGSSVPVANLPVPSDTPIFKEIGKTKYASGCRLTYDTIWRLYGSRIKDEYGIVFGTYTPETE